MSHLEQQSIKQDQNKQPNLNGKLKAEVEAKLAEQENKE